MPCPAAARRAAIVASLALASFGCNGDGPSTPGSLHGTLRLDISGAPVALGADVTVSGPASFGRALAMSAFIDSLAAGNYTVAAAAVSDSTGRWEPEPAEQRVFVELGDTSRASVAYALATSRLAITVAGLPAGTAADVRVTGPGGFARTLGAGARLDSLAPGMYVITALQVRAQDLTWRPTPAVDTVFLTPSTLPQFVAVSYATGSGALTVTVAGLPGGVDAGVTVTGPEGFSVAVRATRTLSNLDAGAYTVTAASVTSADGISQIWSAQPGTQVVQVAEAATAAATVTYAPLALALQLVTQAVPNPTHLTAPPGDARLFIVDRAGRIRIVKDGAVLATPFLDISSRALADGEGGLLSMAFAPDYATSGHFFVYYTDYSGDIRIDRYFAAPGADVADPAPTPVITIPHPTYNNHNGGLLTFGPDGMLYLAPGDGGGSGDPSGNGQNLGTLLGKLLRIDVRTLPYTVPPDNPFVGRAGARPEIWAYGLRNPWRFDVAPGTSARGDLYIADVGQGSWEEIDLVRGNTGGQNFGWSVTEGSRCHPPGTTCSTAGITLPVYEYGRADGCSIIGGSVYRGSAIPELAGHFFFSDYCGGWVSTMLGGGDSTARVRRWLTPNRGEVFSLGRDGAGEIYVLFANGSVFRVVRQP
jgi:glucose/arabinose dehydrogenase